MVPEQEMRQDVLRRERWIFNLREFCVIMAIQQHAGGSDEPIHSRPTPRKRVRERMRVWRMKRRLWRQNDPIRIHVE